MASTAVVTALTIDSSESSASHKVDPALDTIVTAPPFLPLTANVPSSSSSDSLSFPPPMAAPSLSNVVEIGYIPKEDINEERRSSMTAQIDAPEGQQLSQSKLESASRSTTSNTPMHFKSVPSGSIDRILPKKLVGGITVGSIVQLSVILLILAATVVGWVLAIVSAASDGTMSTLFTVLIHILCGTAVIIGLVMLKKCFSRIRAEHRTHRNLGEATTNMAGAVSDAIDIEMAINSALMS